jgi:hypothetical protein
MTMPLTVQSPDRITRLCPLGVRLRDVATGRTVSDGLEVVACPKSDPARRTTATANRSGLYVFRDLPGLRELESADGSAEFWSTLPENSRRPFIVEIEDPSGLFLPFSFEVRLPYLGVFSLDCDLPASPPFPLLSPPASALAQVPLFSAPQRPVPRGLAVLRADLCDTVEEEPARWAVVEVTIAVPFRTPVHGLGIADERGSMLALFSYPEPNDLFPGSPLNNGLPLAEQEWKVSLKAYYRRQTEPPRVPNLCTVLGQQSQPAAQLWNDAALKHELREATLQFGREVILRTTGAEQSKLILTPAA